MNKIDFDSKHALLLAGKLALATETLLKGTVIESVHNTINVELALRQYNDYIFKHTKNN